MTTPHRGSTTNGTHPSSHMPEKTYFEQQRELLVGEIAQVRPHTVNPPLPPPSPHLSSPGPSFPN